LVNRIPTEEELKVIEDQLSAANIDLTTTEFDKVDAFLTTIGATNGARYAIIDLMME